MTGTYAWVIDTDHAADEGAEPGSMADNAVTITGPRTAPDELLAKLAAGEGDQFRLFDGDDELNYTGRFIGGDGPDSEDALGPLDDFGAGNAGCTYIQYKVGGKWKTLN
jgi:hypothetical protein